MLKKMISIAAVAGLVFALAPAAQAVYGTWPMPMVYVGDEGNKADTNPAGYGAVDYTYNIGKYEVTAGQYCDFLNVVAKTDTHGLYNSKMNSDNTYGCQITQNGPIGGYTYDFSGAPDPKTSWTYVEGPVNFVSFYDALRFANWLHNGRPTEGTRAEDGAYDMSLSAAVVRKDAWKWALTSENEWYKAAYYMGGTSADYWNYPTADDARPTAKKPDDQDDTAPGSANHDQVMNPPPKWGHPVDVGSYNAKDAVGNYFSDSPYGTFDQGGNVWEWNEALIGASRGRRGGSFDDEDNMHKWLRSSYDPAAESHIIGFRVSQVPEPATMALLAFGGIAILMRRRGHRR